MSIYTEDNASMRWCPKSIAASLHSNVARNRDSDAEDGPVIPAGCYCIASECMVWVWASGEWKGPQGEPMGRCGLINYGD